MSEIFIVPYNEELAHSLIDACATGQLSQLKTLFKQSQQAPVASVPTPQYLLQTAAKSGQAEAVRLLFDLIPHESRRPGKPWDPYIPDGVTSDQIDRKWRLYEDGVTYSALEGSDPIKVFHVLLDSGMTPEYNLDRAVSPFAGAVARNSVGLAAFFLSRGAKPNGCYGSETDTYLGAAARRSSSDMLNLLIKHGAKVEKSQALRQAVQYGQVRNAEILLGLGADVNEVYTKMNHSTGKDEWASPLHFAIKGGPLHLDRQSPKPEVVRFLLAHRANPDVRDSEGRTPFELAVENHEEDIGGVFKEHGVNK